jgi:transcriptional regulator with XRE-family HTH domain
MTKNKKTNIEQYVIDKVKEIRIKKEFSQEDIASILDTSRGFIGQVESHNYSAKYNLNHLNILAIELGVSPKEFFPEKGISEIKRRKSK